MHWAEKFSYLYRVKDEYPQDTKQKAIDEIEKRLGGKVVSVRETEESSTEFNSFKLCEALVELNPIMNLFTQIEEIVPKLDGWCSVPKAFALASAVLTLRPKVVVELGVYGGRSLIPMALALKEIGEGKCIGIDPWDQNASIQGQTQEHVNFWGTLNHGNIMDTFIANMDKLEVRPFVEVIRMRSDAYNPPNEINILHTDGNHGDQAVRDVARYAPRVPVGGLVFMDDINWVGGSVSQACQNLLAMGFVRLYHYQKDGDDWAVFQRIK